MSGSQEFETSDILWHASQRIVFHHIPKAGGTSIFEELARIHKPSEICPERHCCLDGFRYESLLAYRLFAGHFDSYNVGLIPGPKFVFTFLREPKARILSLYYFWRSHRWSKIENDDLQGPRFAKRMDLLQFLRSGDDIVKLNIDNAMSRSFLGRHDYPEYDRYDRHPQYYADWAFENLSRYNFVGFVEHFAGDMARLRPILGLRDRPLQAMNTFASNHASNRLVFEPIEQQERTPEIEAELDRLTSVDRRFFERAVENRYGLGSKFPL